MAEQLLNKISVKTVFGTIKTDVKDVEGKKVVYLPEAKGIMRVYGQATGYEVKNSDFGESLKFKGVFKAVNMETGEVFRSGACFLPKVFESALGGILDQVESGAEFALDVAVVPANNAHGYEYRVKPLIEAKESPAMAALEDLIGAVPMIALAAPKAAPKAAKK